MIHYALIILLNGYSTGVIKIDNFTTLNGCQYQQISIVKQINKEQSFGRRVLGSYCIEVK